MGAALWRRGRADEAEDLAATPTLCRPACRFRIEVFGKPRAPWRNSAAEALADAKALKLASWDASRKEHFLAVPVDMRVEHVGPAARPR